MVVGSAGHGYVVFDGGIAMAVGVSFEIAHEFVHEGCRLCSVGEDHITPTVRGEDA